MEVLNRRTFDWRSCHTILDIISDRRHYKLSLKNKQYNCAFMENRWLLVYLIWNSGTHWNRACKQLVGSESRSTRNESCLKIKLLFTSADAQSSLLCPQSWNVRNLLLFSRLEWRSCDRQRLLAARGRIRARACQLLSPVFRESRSL